MEESKPKIGRPRKEGGSVTSEGYIRSGKDEFGEAYVHRQVMRKLHPEWEQGCAICRRPILWDELGRYRLIVDHIDHDRSHNDPKNLRMLCETCNLAHRKDR